MKRRDFLGSLVAGATLASLPISVTASPDPIIWNAETLATQLESMFACRMGPATAFYETLAATGELLTVKHVEPDVQNTFKPPFITVRENLDPVPEGALINRYIYESYVCAVEGGDAKEAEARLAKHFYDEFSKVPAGSLVWRTKPAFESHEIVEYGDTYMTAEQIEDEAWKFTPVEEEFSLPVNKDWQLTQFKVKRVRYDEKAELVLPPNVELDFATNNYCYVKRKYTMHRMRMRLVLPDNYDPVEKAIPHLAKQEGEKIVRI